MTTLGKLNKNYQFQLLEGECRENYPSSIDGLVSHYPLDGSVNSIFDLDSLELDILSYNSHNTTWNMKNNLANGTISNGTITTNNTASESEALVFDLVVCDMYVWSINSTIFNTLKTYADAGCVIWSTGNDTFTNNLILDTNSIGTEDVYTGTTYKGSAGYLGVSDGTTVDNTSGDPNNYINEMHSDCIPLYYHDYVGESGIFGFLYLPKNDNGGSLFFDMFGYVTSKSSNKSFLKHLLSWQLGYRKQNKTLTNVQFDPTYNGLNVEESATNLASLTQSTTWDNTGTSIRIIDDNTIPRLFPEMQLISLEKLTDGNSALGIGRTTVNTETIYSTGVWVYFNTMSNEDGSFPYCREYRTDTNGSIGLLVAEDIYGNTYSSFSNVPQNTWLWLKLNNTTSSTDALNYNIFTYLNKSGSKIWFTAPMIVQREFVTSFTSSTRGAGVFTIPNTAPSGGNFTISFKAKLNYVVGASLSYGTILSVGSYNTDSSFTIMDTGDSVVTGYQNLIRKTDISELGWASSNFNSTASEVFDWNTYTVVKDNTNYNIYFNGEYRGYIAHGTSSLQSIIYIGCSGSSNNIANGLYKDISIYNRALSTGEVKNLANQSMSFDHLGNIYTNINEMENENLWQDQNFLNEFTVSTGNIPTKIVHETDGTYYEITLTNNSWWYKGFDISTENGEEYIFSADVYVVSGETFTSTQPLAIEQATSTILPYDWASIPTNQWVYIWSSCVADDSVRFLVYLNTSILGSGTFRFRNVCVRKNSIAKLNYSEKQFNIGIFLEE